MSPARTPRVRRGTARRHMRRRMTSRTKRASCAANSMDVTRAFAARSAAILAACAAKASSVISRRAAPWSESVEFQPAGRHMQARLPSHAWRGSSRSFPRRHSWSAQASPSRVGGSAAKAVGRRDNRASIAMSATTKRIESRSFMWISASENSKKSISCNAENR